MRRRNDVNGQYIVVISSIIEITDIRPTCTLYLPSIIAEKGYLCRLYILYSFGVIPYFSLNFMEKY